MQLAQEDMVLIKGKRSKRPRPSSPLALTIATSSSTTADLSSALSGSCNSTDVTHSTTDIDQEEEEDMANCLILLAKGQVQPPPPSAETYQCKTCDKSFASFQALGGHRASHKKPNKPVNLDERKPSSIMRERKGDFVPTRDDNTNSTTILSLQISNRSVLGNIKSRVHECSICRAEFGSGQALGGHMRRHRPIPAVAASVHGESQGGKRPRNLLSLDLNLPAPEDDHSESKFPFAAKEQVIVFSASPLIDCHY